MYHPSAAPQRGPSAIYGIAPLVLLARAPGQAVFTERALSAALPPGLIADSASSGATPLNSGCSNGRAMCIASRGAAVHWVEGYLQTGVRRYGGQPADVTAADVDTGA